MRLAKSSSLAALVGVYEVLDLTYPEVGATQGSLPTGYQHVRRRVSLGTGKDVFVRASEALMSWQVQRRAGLTVTADGPVALGQTLVMGLGVGICLVVPCRVVAITDELDRRGFTYGTLPDHPERGEESFSIVDSGHEIHFEIAAFSRPNGPVVSAVAPLARLGQRMATRRYEQAAKGLVRTGR
jgi:uncharacterized protein (UPF0548 family)